MKTKLYYILILTILLLTNCNNDYVRVSLTPGISILLPEENLIPKTDTLFQPLLYKVRYDNDEIFVFNLSTQKTDTLSLEEKRLGIKAIMKSAIPTYGVINVDTIDKIVNGNLQFDMNFDYDMGNSQFATFTRFLVTDFEAISVIFNTDRPVTKTSLRTKNKIFNSIKTKY